MKCQTVIEGSNTISQSSNSCFQHGVFAQPTVWNQEIFSLQSHRTWKSELAVLAELYHTLTGTKVFLVSPEQTCAGRKAPAKEVQVQFSCTVVMLHHSSSLGVWGIVVHTAGSGGLCCGEKRVRPHWSLRCCGSYLFLLSCPLWMWAATHMCSQEAEVYALFFSRWFATLWDVRFIRLVYFNVRLSLFPTHFGRTFYFLPDCWCSRFKTW